MKNLTVSVLFLLSASMTAQATVVELPVSRATLCQPGTVSERFTYEQSHNVVNGVKDRRGLITATVQHGGRDTTRLTFAVRGLRWNRGFNFVQAYDEKGRYLNTCATTGPFGLQIHRDRCRPLMRVVPALSEDDSCGEGNSSYVLETVLQVQDGP